MIEEIIDYRAIHDLKVGVISELSVLGKMNREEATHWILHIEKKDVQELYAGSVYIGYYVDATLVGFLGYSTTEGVCSIDHLYIYEEFQKKGIGSQLLDYLFKNNKQDYIYTVRSTKNAEGFYARMGFRKIHDSISKAGFAISIMTKG